MNSSRPSIETLARALREAGAHRVPRDVLESRLGRKLCERELRALAIAADSKKHLNPVKRQHASHEARLRDSLAVTHPSNGKGRADARTAKPAVDYSHSWGESERHTLRLRPEALPEPRKGLDTRRGERNSTPAHEFRQRPHTPLTRASIGSRRVRGRTLPERS